MGTAPPEKSTAQRQKVKHVRETLSNALQSTLHCSGMAGQNGQGLRGRESERLYYPSSHLAPNDRQTDWTPSEHCGEGEREMRTTQLRKFRSCVARALHYIHKSPAHVEK